MSCLTSCRTTFFPENLWNASIWWRVPSRPTQSQILTFFGKNRKKSAVKHSIEEPILLNVVNLSPTFCPRLYFHKLRFKNWNAILMSKQYCYQKTNIVIHQLTHLFDNFTKWRCWMTDSFELLESQISSC